MDEDSENSPNQSSSSSFCAGTAVSGRKRKSRVEHPKDVGRAVGCGGDDEEVTRRIREIRHFPEENAENGVEDHGIRG